MRRKTRRGQAAFHAKLKMKLHDRQLGPGHPAFLIAEIGINHNGDMALALAAIDAAVKAGADAVKFQNYETEDFVSDPTLTFTYRSQGREITESQYELFKRCELGETMLMELASHCAEKGTCFLSTPTGDRGVEALVRAGCPALKNGSDFLGHLPLIKKMARTGLPTMLSTGMATGSEIAEAVDTFRGAGGTDLILLHCISAYPAPAESVNLGKLATLRDRFDCLVGFSDHTEGNDAAALAVACGACVVEKHFTLDHGLPGPDHWFSSTPSEFSELVRRVRRTELMLGSSALEPAGAEAMGRREYRLSCVAARDLSPGTLISSDTLAYHRPGIGLPPRDAGRLVGRRLRTGLRRGDPILEDHLE